MPRRLILLVALLLVFSTILTACTPAASPQAPQPAATTSAQAEPTKAPAAATAAPTQAPAATSRPAKADPTRLILATTTSTQDSGLLDYLLPDFEKKNGVKVDVIAVGTGQAIQIGSKGDADVLLVHARKSEDQFVKDGNAKQRFDVMYNDFIVVGPKADPAKIKDLPGAKEAFKAIADAKATFVSRGDKSGTNTKELGIWSSIPFTPTKEMSWYNAIGQGMGDTLLFANEKQGYTLADRGTWLSMKDKLSGLDVLMGGASLAENKDKSLLNPYGVLPVNPDKFPQVNADVAQKFVDWILSPEVQKMIGDFGVDKYGQPLFYANAKK